MNEKLKFTEKLGFGLGEVMGCVSSVVAAFITMFYTDSIGMAAGAVGTMILVSKCLDGITDLIAGTIVDKTRTRWGKARPWLLWMAIPAGLATALMFMVPKDASASSQLIYAFLTYNLFSSIVYTMVGVAKAALMVRMTYSDMERGSLAIFSLIFGLGGTLLLMSTTFPLINNFSGDTNAWRIVFGIYGVVTMLALVASFLLTEEKIGNGSAEAPEAAAESAAGQEKISFLEGLKLFFSNKYFLIAAGVTVLINFQTNINSSGQVYFYTYNMRDSLLTTSLTLVTLVPTILSIVFLSGICLRQLGKKKCIVFGGCVMIVGYIIKAIAAAVGSVPVLIVGTVIGALATGPLSVPVNVLSADAVDYGDYSTGKRIEGIGSSVVTFSQKISTGLATASVGWILALTGYVPNETQGAAATFGITFIFAYFPIIALVLTLFIVCFLYDYDKHAPEIKEYLSKKH